MRQIITAVAALALASCGGGGNPEPRPSEAARPMNPAFGGGPSPSPSPTAFPLPAAQPSGMVNPEAPPDVARHIARQERCLHWRSERDLGAVRPEVSQGIERECRGIDAELQALRRRYDSDGTASGLLRPFIAVGS